MLDRKKAKKKFITQLEEIESLKRLDAYSPEFLNWQRQTKILLQFLFGENASIIEEYNKISYSPSFAFEGMSKSMFEKQFQNGLEEVKLFIQSIIDLFDDVDVKKDEAFYNERICYLNLKACPYLNIRPNYSKAFVMMPFKKDLTDFYHSVVKKTLKEMNISCIRADEKFDAPNSLCNICQAIIESGILIADMTDKNPNVFCEIGMCFGRGRRVILICQSGDDNPFDTKIIHHIKYNLEDPSNFISKFKEFIRVAIKDEMKYTTTKSIRSATTSNFLNKDLLDKIYSPLYSRIVGSLELLDQDIFGCGKRENNLGERVLNVISGLKRNILWEKADQELKNKVEPLYNLYEEVNLLEDKLANEIISSFYNKYDFMKRIYNEEIKRIKEKIKELRYFILKEYNQLDSTRISTINEFLEFAYTKTRIENKNSQFFWTDFQNFARTSVHYVDYLRKREEWKNSLNEIKNLLSSFI
ncbi:MAG: hypothetical protein ACFFB5_06415 [Promethearchaeota archaeon]